MRKLLAALLACALLTPVLAEEPCPHARETAADYVCQLQFDEPAGDELFEEALLIGDSLAYSLADYGVIETLDVECYIGLSPEHVARARNMLYKGEYVTIVELAAASRPDKLLVLFGSNGLTYKDAAEVLVNYHGMVDAIVDTLPWADIYLLSVTPVDTWVKKEARGLNMGNILAFNEGVRSIAQAHGVHYIDVCTPLTAADGSGIHKDYVAKDGIHLTYEGARVLTETIRYQVDR